jgi:glycosyltransferase involved in cell wall biosynthesis
MDGGSTDDTLSVLKPYVQYFHHFSTGSDKGQADAIATGFEKTSGDIMGYLNSDDMLAPGALHFVSAYFRGHPEVDFIYSHRCIVDTADRVIGYWYLPPHFNYLMQRLDLILSFRKRPVSGDGSFSPLSETLTGHIASRWITIFLFG